MNKKYLAGKSNREPKRMKPGYAPKTKNAHSLTKKSSSPVKANQPAMPGAMDVNDGLIRLNKYIGNSGMCSRREADEYIANGLVTVNGKIISTLGTKIRKEDVVKIGGHILKTEKPVYLLLNKPKDYITTLRDTHQRKTVMDLIGKGCKERVYPVGRLDRATTGVLMLTNDGDLTKKLTHPRYGAQKVYHVQTDDNVEYAHLVKLREGIMLEDGMANADEAHYVGDGKDKRQIGITLHSGRNRIVRRMFEALGYKTIKLDRVLFAGLTKKGLEKGQWRFLSEKEVSILKMLPSGAVRKVVR